MSTKQGHPVVTPDAQGASVQGTQMLGHLPREDVGSHTKDFGAYGDDPLKREVGGAREMTGAATTRDLAAGTARSTLQVPGVVPSL